MSNSRIILSHNLQEFFRTEVSEASSSIGVNLDGSLEYYLVNLLCEFGRSEESPTPGDEPLAFIYKRAIEAHPEQRVGHLKELGDIALYVAGFFTEFIERSLVDIDYYISMGGGAYANLSQLFCARRAGEAFAELYESMGQRFTELVDVLNEVSQRTNLQPANDTDLLRLYDRWQRTKSQRIEKQLSSRGLLPIDMGSTDFIQ